MAYDDHVEEGYLAARQAEAATAIAARANSIKIEINRIRINLDPIHDVFNIVINGDDGEWRHTAGSEANIRTFLEGVRAGIAVMGGRLKEPIFVPRQPTSIVKIK